MPSSDVLIVYFLIVDFLIIEDRNGLDETNDGGAIRTSGLYCFLRNGQIFFDRRAAD
jgi:hypothetical protein